MKTCKACLATLVLGLVLSGCSGKKSELNSHASHLSPSARTLLSYLEEIGGRYTLTGQHNYLGRLNKAPDSLFRLTGKYPAIWGSDFGFSAGTEDIDAIAFRPALVDAIREQHRLGSIITITYHQASPTVGEPCDFEGGVQVEISESQWDDILTPGTELYKHWRKQMDLIASYLLQLKKDGIPILFRPYHEMNGSWFWWGGAPGEHRFIALWKQLYQLYVEVHELDNLIWVWSPDDPDHGLDGYYPGDEYVDIVASDIYHFGKEPPIHNVEDYRRILSIAPGKPLGIGETSEIPTEDILENQPMWTWFMTWEDLVFERNDVEIIREVYHSERFLTRDELPDFKSID